jgi:hypothetical protein
MDKHHPMPTYVMEIKIGYNLEQNQLDDQHDFPKQWYLALFFTSYLAKNVALLKSSF